MFTTDRHNITAHGPGPALLLVWVPVLVPQVAADEGRGHAEVEGEEEREDGHHRVQLQHHAALVLAEARLLDAARLLVDGLLLVVETDHRHPVGHVPLLVGGGEGLVVHGQVPLKIITIYSHIILRKNLHHLHSQSVVIVGDDEVQAGVEPSPAPDVLPVSVQSSAASQTFSVECVLVQVLRTPTNRDKN